MQFIITAKTTLTFSDTYIEQLQAKGKTVEDMTDHLKKEFETLIAGDVGAPDGDFLGYSLTVDVTTNEKEESDV